MKVETMAAGEIHRGVSGRLVVETHGQGFVDVTRPLGAWISAAGVAHGLATLFCRHTSASLVIQENADPDVRADLLTALDGFAPRGADYRHADEGPDDMPAHIRTMLTASGLSIPIVDGRLGLGTWQGVYLVEHRDRPHRRELLVNLIGW